MTHIVRRPFIEAGALLKPGTKVDASVWPNLNLLLAQGYLAPAPSGPDLARSDPKAAPSKGRS